MQRESESWMRAKRWIAAGGAVLVVLWLAFLVFIGWAMRQPPALFGSVMARVPPPAYMLFPFETMWTAARRGTVKPGGMAPDGTVQRLDTRQTVELASLWTQRPVVLVFGSYT